ncbi:hypothetical protein B0H14DRAFT_3558369 [Mycena olivaceomarginata]|nr:hypothetical protein B0H14DRAFT_3558369 [Mycena olivaceomarginata]
MFGPDSAQAHAYSTLNNHDEKASKTVLSFLCSVESEAVGRHPFEKGKIADAAAYKDFTTYSQRLFELAERAIDQLAKGRMEKDEKEGALIEGPYGSEGWVEYTIPDQGSEGQTIRFNVLCGFQAANKASADVHKPNAHRVDLSRYNTSGQPSIVQFGVYDTRRRDPYVMRVVAYFRFEQATYVAQSIPIAAALSGERQVPGGFGGAGTTSVHSIGSLTRLRHRKPVVDVAERQEDASRSCVTVTGAIYEYFKQVTKSPENGPKNTIFASTPPACEAAPRHSHEVPVLTACSGGGCIFPRPFLRQRQVKASYFEPFYNYLVIAGKANVNI